MSDYANEYIAELAVQVSAAVKMCAVLVAAHPRGPELQQLIEAAPLHAGAKMLSEAGVDDAFGRGISKALAELKRTVEMAAAAHALAQTPENQGH
jgi:hypothetical protein